MKSVVTSATNHTFTCPPSVPNCEPLHVYRDPDGRFTESCWSLDDEEVAEIVRTKRMHILIVGAGMPPISPSVRSQA